MDLQGGKKMFGDIKSKLGFGSQSQGRGSGRSYDGGYDDYDDYDDYAEYDDYEDYDDYDDYDDRYDDDRDGYRNHAYGRDAPPGREDLARDPGSWDDLIDGPLWPEGEDPLTGRPRTGESRRTERGRRP